MQDSLPQLAPKPEVGSGIVRFHDLSCQPLPLHNVPRLMNTRVPPAFSRARRTAPLERVLKTNNPTVLHLKASVDQYLLELVDPFHKGRRETVVVAHRGTAP